MDAQQNLDRINIILVEPQSDGNIGSACRAIKTMGLSKLSIVSNQLYNEETIRSLAVHAFDIYENSKRFNSLSEAIKDSVLVVATSRRRGKQRKSFALNLEQLVEIINETGKGIISIVFGSERDGLSVKDLSLCNAVLKIPSSNNFASLNLAQAVQIVTFSLFTALKELVGFAPITNERLNGLTENIGNSLKELSLNKNYQQKELQQLFYDILARSRLSEKEAQKLEQIFFKIELLLKSEKLK